MTSTRPLMPPGSTMRAHIIRVHSLGGRLQPVYRYAVLSASTQDAMAAVVRLLDLCDVASVTDEVLDPSIVAHLELQPNRPHRLS